MLGATMITWAASPSSAGHAPRGALVDAMASSYGTVLVVGSGRLAGYPLYEFSGDAGGTVRCGTTLAKGFDLGPSTVVPLTCTGPEKDILDGNATDDWPAFTTTGAPVAAKGVDAALLGVKERPGIGDQVTYAGHPLYLFDPVSKPFVPAGEDYVETVKPLAPWHGFWFLVAASDGAPAPGRAQLEVGVLKDGTRVLAALEDPNADSFAMTVYTFSADANGSSSCVGRCALTWQPLLTSGPVRVAAGVRASQVGEIARGGGEEQVTYDGHPLYLYSREKVFRQGLGLRAAGSAGNGDGLRGPDGGTFSYVTLTP